MVVIDNGCFSKEFFFNDDKFIKRGKEYIRDSKSQNRKKTNNRHHRPGVHTKKLKINNEATPNQLADHLFA